MEDRLLTLPEVARMLGMSTPGAKAARSRGHEFLSKFAVQNGTSSVRYRLSDAQAYIKNLRTGA